VSSTAPARVDGRTARRDRNSEAALDAVRELFVEGNFTPTAEAVALRSGVSLRSVFRYFEDTDALLRAALQRSITLAEPLFDFPELGVGSLEQRITRMVDHRLVLYATLGPEARVAVLRGPSAPLVAEQLDVRRAQLTRLVRQQFAPELRAAGTARGRQLLDCADALLQFESLEHLIRRGGLSQARARKTLVTGLTALLG
jgi:AcrR family transcriptional regulator